MIILFRMGDFYETFGDDAKVVSRELNIVLTSRSYGGGGGRMPLAGIPHHALDNYLAKLVRKGHRVAICEQVEDPRKAKGLVKREVVRVVTPGTVLEDSILDARANNYLAAIAPMADRYGVAFLDISTGEFFTTEFGGKDRLQKLLGELARFQPREAILPEGWDEEAVMAELDSQGAAVSRLDRSSFQTDRAGSVLKGYFKVAALDGYGLVQMEAATSAAGAALDYALETQKGALPLIERLGTYSLSDHMVLDSSTLRNLEVVRNIRDGGTANTLFSVLDRTLTPLGSRLLKRWLQQPLIDPAAIAERLDSVGELAGSAALREGLAGALKAVRDLERIIARTVSGSANARDLVALKDSLNAMPELKAKLAGLNTAMLRRVVEDMGDLGPTAALLEKALVEEPPLALKEGGIIREGYDDGLDKLKRATKEGKAWLADLQETERKRTGIKSLKVEFNKVFGYYITVTKPNMHLVPEDYIRKQTLANSERYITPGLKEKETLILSSEEKRNALEYDLFCGLRETIAGRARDINQAARAVARLDVLLSLAESAVQNRYVRPEVDLSGDIDIVDGRHPVVEAMLQGGFVPNSTHLDMKDDRMVILTGPNMAGKSTYMRQVALITLMAQVGSYVPAAEARIGVVDRIFTRVGAYDDLTRGQSTFMVEMTEIANILNSATEKSLVLLDELGRGTSTFDGLSIAWAVTEYLYDPKTVGAKTIFATHYHHLNEMSDLLDGVKNYNVTVKEDAGDIVFIRKVVPGGTDKSYGIQVARLAGVPEAVVSRARRVLEKLEQENVLEVKKHVAPKRQATLGLFGPAPPKHPVLVELEALDVNMLTPIEALNVLNQMKRRLDHDHD